MLLDLRETLTSGQCFRASCANGIWTVYSGVDEDVKVLNISQNDLSVIEKNQYWKNYFDMDMSYCCIREQLSLLSPVMKQACDFAPGIRILNQNPWEALCSFVVSQNNNIKRITGIIAKMCLTFGKDNGFPCADTLAGATEESLRACGLGFRALYIINTATAVCENKIDFKQLKNLPVDEARKCLMRVKGIGPKVADCALLFGCHRLDCFPVDTWMKKVMTTYFKGKDASFFGEYAGIAQQYLFYYIREQLSREQLI